MLRVEERGSHTDAEWEAILDRYGHRCVACGRSDALLTKDHVRPLARAGANTADNLQPLDGSCNSRKGAKWIDWRPLWDELLDAGVKPEDVVVTW